MSTVNTEKSSQVKATVLEFNFRYEFPKHGAFNTIYCADDINRMFRWDGRKYILLNEGEGADVNAVHYTKDRCRTEAEKEQARKNIGTMAADAKATGDALLNKLNKDALSGKTYDLTQEGELERMCAEIARELGATVITNE